MYSLNNDILLELLTGCLNIFLRTSNSSFTFTSPPGSIHGLNNSLNLHIFLEYKSLV